MTNEIQEKQARDDIAKPMEEKIVRLSSTELFCESKTVCIDYLPAISSADSEFRSPRHH